MTQKESTVNVFNRQRRLPLEVSPLRSFLVALAERLPVTGAFTVVLVSDSFIRKLNRQFRSLDASTDVLSFPAGGDALDDPSYLGDIVISVESAERQRRGSLEEELKVLALHGILHLMGYDHEVDRGEMTGVEAKLRRELGLR